MPIKSYTIKVAASKSVQQIQELLVAKGARQVMIEYDTSALPIAINFTTDVSGRDLFFRVPVNVEGCYKALNATRISGEYKTRRHAIKVAWRHVFYLVEAVRFKESAMAFIESGQADLAKMYIGDAIHPETGQTMYEAFQNQLQLTVADKGDG